MTLEQFYWTKRVLVTGGTGYIGSALVKRLIGLGAEVHVQTRHPDLVPDEARACICDFGLAMTRWPIPLDNFDCVFHLAGQTSVKVADQAPHRDWGANVLPMLLMLDACRSLEQKPIIVFAGTATECGLDSAAVRDNPVTVYDLHKLMAERYLELYAHKGWARGVTLRLANVYGPGGQKGVEERGVLNRMIMMALCGNNLSVYGHGRHFRDYVFSEDVLNAFLMAGSNIDHANGCHYEIGTGRRHSVGAAFWLIASMINRRGGYGLRVRQVPHPDGVVPEIETRNFVANISPFIEDTGWKPTVSLSQGIERTIDWIIGHG